MLVYMKLRNNMVFYKAGVSKKNADYSHVYALEPAMVFYAFGKSAELMVTGCVWMRMCTDGQS
jgi:hypothetical protein